MYIIPFDIQVIYNAVTEGPDVDNSSLANIFDIEPNSGRDTSSIHAGPADRVININVVSVTQYAHVNTYVLSMYMCAYRPHNCRPDGSFESGEYGFYHCASVTEYAGPQPGRQLHNVDAQSPRYLRARHMGETGTHVYMYM